MTMWLFEGIALLDGDPLTLSVGDGEQAVLPGKFGLPGLVDAHCHLTVDGDAEPGPLRGPR